MSPEIRSRLEPPHVSAESAADYLGLTSKCLANWRWRGQGPKYLVVGSRVRYRLSDLDEYLSRCERTPSASCALR